MSDNDNRPVGSGILVLIFGIAFMIVGITPLISKENIFELITNENLLISFSLVNGILFILWGIERIKNRSKDVSLRVGRETIMFVMTIVSTFVAIIALTK